MKYSKKGSYKFFLINKNLPKNYNKSIKTIFCEMLIKDQSDFTLYLTALAEGKFETKASGKIYFLRKKVGSLTLELYLGDPSSAQFGTILELNVYNTLKDQEGNNYLFGKLDKNWFLLSSSNEELKDGKLSIDVTFALDEIFIAYFNEVEYRSVPKSLQRNMYTDKDISFKSQKKSNTQNKSSQELVNDSQKALFDLLDEDLLKPIVKKVVEDGVKERDIERLELKAATDQIKRLRKLNSSDSKSNQSDLNQKCVKMFVDKVWEELTMRLGFPNQEKEEEIYQYYSELVNTWLPVALNGITPKKVIDPVVQRNFYNDLEDCNIYPETKVDSSLIELCQNDQLLNELVIDYIKNYGRDSVREWWEQYRN